MIPLSKQSKKLRKAYNSKMRGDWNGVSPVTKIVPDGKLYDRRKFKRIVKEELY